MQYRRSTWAILGLLAMVNLVSTSTSFSQETPSVFDKRPYAEAKAAAEQGKLWYIVDGTASWCAPCKQMDATTWKDSKIFAWLSKHAVVYSLDVDKEESLARELSIDTMPTIIAFQDGKEFDRVQGYQSPEVMLTWLEAIARGEKSLELVRKKAGDRNAVNGGVDIRARLELARSLVDHGELDEATDEYVWLWEHMLEHDSGYYGVRLSFMASDMSDLVKKSAASRDRISKLRDQTGKRLEGEKIARNDLVDWVELNNIIGDTQATLAWYDRVRSEPRWKPMIAHVSDELEELLVEAKRYADIGSLYDDPVRVLQEEFDFCKELKSMEDDERFRPRYDQRFQEKAGLIYASVLAANRNTDAELVASKARSLDPSTAMLVALISTSLDAGQPRKTHLEWIGQAPSDDPKLVDLKQQVEVVLNHK